MDEKITKFKIKVLEKLINQGYDNDKKMMDFKLEELLLLPNFTRAELNIAVGIKYALINKSLVSYLCSEKVNYSSVQK